METSGHDAHDSESAILKCQSLADYIGVASVPFGPIPVVEHHRQHVGGAQLIRGHQDPSMQRADVKNVPLTIWQRML